MRLRVPSARKREHRHPRCFWSRRMTTRTQARRFATEAGHGLLTFLRSLRQLLETSRLLEALGYGLTCIFVLTPVSFIGQGLNWALARDSTGFALAVVLASAVFL